MKNGKIIFLNGTSSSGKTTIAKELQNVLDEVIKSLTIGRNKINSKTQIKLAKLKKGSRKYLKVRKANKHVNLRIDNKVNCGFKDDRDVVGAKNIYKVSFGLDIKSKLDVIGFLTKPIGWKYKTNRDCKINLYV